MTRRKAKGAHQQMLETGIADNETTMYMVDISYPLHIWREPEDPSISLRKLARAFGGQDAGSGAGMGRRDIAFGFKTFIEALAFVGDIERTKNPFVRIDSLFVATDDDSIPLDY
jgi:hypothetical protein